MPKLTRKLNLFYLSGNTTGGWVTYTAHLIYGLQSIGVDVSLFKIGNNTERKTRRFGYDCSYTNLSLEDAVSAVKSSPSVITALQKNFRDNAAILLEAGAWLVVHDPAEFKNLQLANCDDRYITIRKAVQRQVPKSIFVPHPYKRYYPSGTVSTGKIHACSVSRIDFDKHTEIILEANRILPPEKRVQIHGFENRLYTKFKICPDYPEWQQSVSAYPREKQAAVEICHEATFSVDMSIIKGDGGGTQYTFMEAMDAGSVNILHDAWILPDDEMIPIEDPGGNCLTVVNGEELAQVLKTELSSAERDSLLLNSDELLAQHDPAKVATKFMKVLNA